MRRHLIIWSIFVACLFFSFSAVHADAQKKRLERTDEHRFRLYEAPSKNNAYSVQYNIKLEDLGMISVSAIIGGGKIKGHENAFKLWIVDARGIKDDTNKIEKKYIKKTVNFHKLGTVAYPIDASDFNQSKGKFVIIISNTSKESHGVGTIKITYPAQEEKTISEEKPRERKQPRNSDEEKRQRSKRE